MTGMASHTGICGWAISPRIIHSAINVRKKMCMRYMPKVSWARLLIQRGAEVMQVNNRKAPKVERRTLGVQNSHDHSIIGVSIVTPGTAFHQKLHAEKAAPTIKQTVPTARRLRCDQLICTRM